MAQNSTKTSDEILQEIFQPASYVDGSFVQQPAFEKATQTPDSTINTLKFMKQHISNREFEIHRNNYLRGSLQAIQKHQFDAKHTDFLADTVNWFIQKKPIPHSQTYHALLKLLMEQINQKVKIPQEVQQQWTNALTRKSPICIPKDIGLIPENAVEPSFTFAKHFSKRLK